MSRSRFYVVELFMEHLKQRNIAGALEFAEDLKNYANKKEVKDKLDELIHDLEYRHEEGIAVSEEWIEKALIVVHQIRMGN